MIKTIFGTTTCVQGQIWLWVLQILEGAPGDQQDLSNIQYIFLHKNMAIKKA